MEARKIAPRNLFAGKEWRHRCREWTCRHSWGGRECDEWRKKVVPCDSLESWDGEGREDICVLI